MTASLSTRPTAAFVAAWAAGGLDAAFRAERPNTLDDDMILFNTRAKPNTAFPYCVFAFGPGRVVSRHSWERTVGKEIRAARLTLTIWHNRLDKAGHLAERVADVVNGHAIQMNGNSGCIIHVLHVDDFGGRDPDGGEEEWFWKMFYDVVYDAETNI